MPALPGSSPLDPFIPRPDIRERVATSVEAPAALVLEAARAVDLQAVPLVRGIFRLREWLMGVTSRPRRPQGLLEELVGLGWGILQDVPGRVVVGGAACQPWNADVVFRPLAAETFASFAEPDQVKIAWTLEVEALSPERTRFVTETRAVATDAAARRQFLRYWRWARFGIVAIRLLVVPAVRREAERRWRDEAGQRPPGPARRPRP